MRLILLLHFIFIVLGGKVSDRLTKSVDLLLIGGVKEGNRQKLFLFNSFLMPCILFTRFIFNFCIGGAMSSKQRAALALGTATLTEAELESALQG